MMTPKQYVLYAQEKEELVILRVVVGCWMQEANPPAGKMVVNLEHSILCRRALQYTVFQRNCAMLPNLAPVIPSSSCSCQLTAYRINVAT